MNDNLEHQVVQCKTLIEISDPATATLAFLVLAWLGIRNPSARNWLLKMSAQWGRKK